MIDFKDHRLLFNEHNDLVFKCKNKSTFKVSWLGATEVPILDNSRDIIDEIFLLEIITFISVVTSIIWRGVLRKEGDSQKFRY